MGIVVLSLVVHEPNRRMGFILVARTFKLNTLQFKASCLKLAPDQGIGGDKLFGAPTDELSVLGRSNRAGSSGFHIVGEVVSHREIITDAEVILFGFGDGFEHSGARALDVLTAAGGDIGGLTMHIAL